MIGFLLLLVIAAICGSIGAALAGGRKPTGCLVSIALGFIGALLGSYLAGKLHLPELFTVRLGGQDFPLIWSIIGSALFVAVLSLLRGKSS